MGGIGDQRNEKLAVATRGLLGWSSWEHLMACSATCQGALSQRPPFTDYDRQKWTPFGA
jgi:hypothetical protein